MGWTWSGKSHASKSWSNKKNSQRSMRTMKQGTCKYRRWLLAESRRTTKFHSVLRSLWLKHRGSGCGLWIIPFVTSDKYSHWIKYGTFYRKKSTQETWLRRKYARWKKMRVLTVKEMHKTTMKLILRRKRLLRSRTLKIVKWVQA